MRTAQSSNDISTAAATERISPPKENGKSLTTSMVKKKHFETIQFFRKYFSHHQLQFHHLNQLTFQENQLVHHLNH
jgi:hypothetical protein